MSHFFTSQRRSSRQIRPPHIKPGTTPKGTRSSTIPHSPVAPSGGYGPPSGGIGYGMNPPRTKGGTPIPGLTYVHRVPGENRKYPFMPMFNLGGQGRDDRFFRGDGRDRGPIPHPMQMRSLTDRWFKHLKPQRGEGHFADFFRSRIGFGDVHECNRGQHFEDGHHEFTLCDRNRRFLANGIGWSLEEAIENARRFGHWPGDIFDFDRNQWIPPNQFLANPSVLGSGLPVASPFGPSFPPIMQPSPEPRTPNYFPPSPYNIDTTGSLPDTTVLDDGTGTDTGSSGTNMQADASDGTGDGSGEQSAPEPPQGAGGSGGSQILDQIKSHLPIVILIGAGLALLLIVKK